MKTFFKLILMEDKIQFVPLKNAIFIKNKRLLCLLCVSIITKHMIQKNNRQLHTYFKKDFIVCFFSTNEIFNPNSS